MPKAKTGNFTLKKIAAAVPAANAAHRFAALQRSGQYRELRFIQRGKAAFDIVGYRWPDKGVRRKFNIGRARVNPSPSGAATPNQVLFGLKGKTVVGWINAETPTRYQITYKVGAQSRAVWRKKNRVKFQRSGKYGSLSVLRNNCPKTANPPASGAVHAATELSQQFHGFKPRRIQRVRIDWPKALTHLGQCAQVDYVCRKFDGKTRRYFHEFENVAHVLAAPNSQPDGDSLLIIKGKFRIKPEGITG
jgi:hypothetical protein